jgi:hypothetical protein
MKKVLVFSAFLVALLLMSLQNGFEGMENDKDKEKKTATATTTAHTAPK